MHPGSDKTIDSLAWIHVRDRRLLSVRTAGKAKFYLPGGKREPGEGDVACLCREIREELGITLDPLSFRFFAALEAPADGFADGRLVRMTCYTADHEGEPSPSREIAEAAWLGSAEAAACPPAGQRVLRMLTDAGLVD
ncbi:NUDIX domain-containing protein [Amycolatopsis sp. NEAU-NG30]|uniref:NUDIX domain-containing protein n=1 Tax=Amycolatopsis melonis TaxID=3156488 RepID=A0ABV0LS76_9PSEU